MIKKDDLYFPEQKGANLDNEEVYDRASADPIKFWENLAQEGIVWREKWQKAFEHQPPYFKWFLGGKLNITESCLDRHSKERGDQVALIWEAEPVSEKPRLITYKELLSDVCRFANALKSLGVKKGDRVAIYLPVIPEVVISMLACARIGAVHSVVFSAFSAQALKTRLEDTKAKILITADGYFRRGQIIDLKMNADQALEGTAVEKVVVVKRAANQVGWNSKTDAWYSELVKDQKDFCLAESMDSEDPFFILYTSGSTGKPKGILHNCGGYAVQALGTGKWVFDFKEKDVFWCTSDPGWVTGHTYTIYSPLLNGITTLIFEGAPDFPKEDRWAKIIEKHGVTIFYTAPTAIRMFQKYGSEPIKEENLSTIRLLGSVGEPIDEAAWLWYFENVGRKNCPIVDTWWQTETGGILISSLPGIGPFKPGYAGKPLPGIKVDILDEEGKSCPVGQKGNLVILPPFAPGMLRGVYNNPEKYLETYWSQYPSTGSGQVGQIYFTSDAALKDENGLVRILGRVDDVIKVAGHRLSTGELENAINKHPLIGECAVIGISDKIKGEAIVVFAISSEALAKEDVGELKQAVVDQLKKEIGPFALPKEVYIADDLPKTRSGKIMRRILKRLFTGEELGDLSTLSNPEVVEKIQKQVNDNKKI